MGALAALPRRPLPVRRRRRRRARHRDREPRADEGRDRRACPTRASPRCSTRSRGPAPRRPTTRSRRSSRTSPSCRCATRASTRSRETVGASNIVPDTIDFHDIAGLVAGAHKGEGLGNQFLANIRETDALLHVVRCHHDDERHPSRRAASTRRADMETIETELVYADLEQAERRHARVVREARGGDKAAIAEEAWLARRDRRRSSAASRRAPCRCPPPRPTRCATSRR